MNVKVKVGQVWECVKDSLWVTNYGDKAKISKVGNNNVYYNDSLMSAKAFDRCFKFIPQNDLEWLAVKLDKWGGRNTQYAIRKDNDRVVYGIGSHQKPGEHYMDEWQSMRYSLGLDTKPHYKLIGGQWTKAA